MVSIADIDAEERVDDSLEEIMKLKFGLNHTSRYRSWILRFDQSLEAGSESEAEFWSTCGMT